MDEQGRCESVQLWRAGDVPVPAGDFVGWRCHEEQLLHSGAPRETPPSRRPAQVLNYNSLREGFPFSSEGEQTQGDPTAEERKKESILGLWWCT